MRHRLKGRHLSRTAEHRRALYRNLTAALFEHGRIRTTDAKAREVRPLAERMITLGRRGDLHARRLAARMLGDGVALERLFGPIARRFAERPGGYTRLVKAGRRHGDAAPLAYLELLDEKPRVVRAPAEGEEEEAPKGGRGKTREGERKGGARTASRERRAKAAAGSEPRPGDRPGKPAKAAEERQAASGKGGSRKRGEASGKRSAPKKKGKSE